jgi:hypothetical protein
MGGMKMKTTIIWCVVVVANVCWVPLLAGVIPEVKLDDTKAGVQVTFDVSPFKTPIDWGKRTGGAGDALYSGGRGTHFDGQYHRYQPTLKGDAGVVGMSTNEDWVMSMKIEIVTNAPGNITIFETSAASGGDMAKLVTTAVPNEFRLDGRSGGTTYGTIATFTMTSAVEHTLTMHFKVANSKLDFYMDDTLIASDFEGRANGGAGSPFYDINFYQVDHSSSNIGVYTYDDVLIGPLAPPDGTVVGIR